MSLEQKTVTVDVVVLGSGSGGYVTAIRAAEGGKTVALVEEAEIGGVCLNCGCIPTKTLIAGADLYRKINKAKEFGIEVGSGVVHYEQMKKRKDSVVGSIRKSLEGLIRSHKIQIVRGFGQFVAPGEIKVSGLDNVLLKTQKTIIATGSKPRALPGCAFDHKKILDSTSILEVTQLPKKIAIVGGGIIGCEFASLFATLGSEVVILEALETIVATEGKKASETLSAAFKKRGIQIQTKVSVEGINTTEKGVSVRLQGGALVEADLALVAIGRTYNTQNLGLEKARVQVHAKGFIEVDDHMQTTAPGIYAVGDVTGKWLLAHVASHQGIVAAQNILGIQSRMHYDAIPSVTYTYPEIATVGMTLEKALEKGIDATLGQFPFAALGKSLAINETEGFAQIVVDKKTGQVLGAQVVGYEASSLIAEMTLAIQNELLIECITDTVHAHPSLPESWLEAAFIAQELHIHMPPKVKRS